MIKRILTTTIVLSLIFILISAFVNPLGLGITGTKTFTGVAWADSPTIKTVTNFCKEAASTDKLNNTPVISLSTSVPDLIIEAITLSPAQPSIGDMVTFTVTIKNQGNGNAISSRVAYYIDDVFLASVSVDSLAAGDTDAKYIFWKAQAGAHVVKAVADFTEKVTESDETNNVKTYNFTTLAPDLIIEDITWSPAQPSVGDIITFTVTIKNQGSGNSRSSGVYFYIDDLSRDYEDVLRIEAGDMVTKTFTWTAQTGSHTIKAIVDKDNWIPESDESNNEKAVIFSPLLPDLIIEDITWSPESPSQSDNVTFTVYIKNQGDGRAGYSRLTYYIDDDYLTSVTVSPLDPGATDNKTFYWIAKAGTRSIKAVADSNTLVPESDEDNNEMTVTLTLASDLIIENITWSPESPSVGETITFTVTIKNQGNAKAYSSRVFLYIDDTSMGYQKVQTIAVDSTVSETFTWTVQEGSHAIRAVADKENWLLESNEDNNEKTVTFGGAFFPDLIVQDITWSPESPSVGETVTFAVTIKNQGDGRAGYSYVTYYVDNVRLTSVYVSPLDPDATDNKTFTWLAQAGYHTIKVVADSNTRIPEEDENNNEGTVIYPVPPDLIIEAITWSPESPSKSDNVTFTVTVKNQGNMEADSSYVACYIYDAYLTSASVSPLNPGATDNKTFTWLAQAGSNTFKAVADSKSEVPESNETNNEMTVTFKVPLPDLIIEAITWSPESPLESDNVTFRVIMKNQGGGKADSFDVACYINDAYLTSVSFNPLNSAASDNKTFPWTAQAGSHNLKVVADGANYINEEDESNNERVATFSVLSPPEPAPAPAPTPGPKPPQVPAEKPTLLPSLGKGIWLDLLFVLVMLVLIGTIVMTVLRSQRQR